MAMHGRILVSLIISVCSSGFLLFGYDQGVLSGVLLSSHWLKTMGNPSTLMQGTITALYDVGAVVGALCAAFSAEPMGRKATLLIGASVLLAGAMLMGTSFSRTQFIVGRIVTGIGIGFITSVAPVYQAEVSTKAQRGWHVCASLTTMLVGLSLAYWINYGVLAYDSDVQWRLPLLFQAIFAIYIIAVTGFLPESPRWLLKHRRSKEDGGEVLARLRGTKQSDADVRGEVAEILAAIDIEEREAGGWADLLRSGGISAHKRFYLAIGIQFMQQLTGINIVTYYAPTLYQSSLGMDQREALFLGCFTQVFYVLASFVTWYTIDKVGRRKSFISMAFGMAVILVGEAICVSQSSHQGAAVTAVVLVFLFEACFTWGWMATVWVYPPEILPLKIRAKGAALAAGADFLGNFLVVECTPSGIKNIGWRFYIIWAVLNLCNAIIVWLFFPETAGLQLEAVDHLFLGPDSAVAGFATGRQHFYSRFQWRVVSRANIAIRESKIENATP